jgi:Leucine-rich repeat (LRR) protein
MNDFKTVPVAIKHMVSLTHLSMSFNRITTVPVWVFFIPSLVTLVFSGNRISSLPSLSDVDKWLNENPEWINAEVTKLGRSNTLSSEKDFPLKDLITPGSSSSSSFLDSPEVIGSHLQQGVINKIASASRRDHGQIRQRIAVCGYGLNTIVTSFMPRFETISFSSNRLSSFPYLFLFYSSSLSTLNMGHNRINFIPKTLFMYCSKLTRVDLSYNHISSLPITFIDFSKKAISCDMSHNLLQSLPQFPSVEPELVTHQITSSSVNLDVNNEQISTVITPHPKLIVPPFVPKVCKYFFFFFFFELII